MQIIRSIIKIPNMLRRRIMILVDKDYISKKLAKRRGRCRKCGQCCIGCRHLDKDKLCKTYGNRPALCHQQFPIDSLDQNVWGVKDCGYRFEKH